MPTRRSAFPLCPSVSVALALMLGVLPACDDGDGPDDGSRSGSTDGDSGERDDDRDPGRDDDDVRDNRDGDDGDDDDDGDDGDDGWDRDEDDDGPSSGDGPSEDPSGPTGGDIGDQCSDNADCSSNSCLVSGDAVFGYCTIVCQGFADCPAFWDCEPVGNASANYCQQ